MPASSSIKYGFLLIDYIVLGVFLSLSVGVGVFYAIKSWRLQQVEEEKNEKSQGDKVATEDYLMGGRNMPVLPMALSLLTTFLSGIVMLGTPAEVFQRGMWIMLRKRIVKARDYLHNS
uniref:Uncharacterized protein n=1 Tax=Plectus sambesii TaxID=2011161 RepID=A0A914VTT1_9BILA